ncbi:TonB-dependent receptor [Indioceanicola profundi]|uniref:TonB-dependent receptor n=1 Tax=Indioceanicola profundi TaxID=2220096 RepID=UPI000E6AA969|nr:TonB-dependent siderophore receptor [Indioceanicola profundi]
MRTSSWVCALFAVACGLPLNAAAQEGAAAPAEEIEEIVVIGSGSQVGLTGTYAGGQVARGGRAGLLGNLDMMDTPFATTAYTADLIREQQARSVADVLQNDPVVRVARGFGNFQELYVIRGFPVYSDDMTYNGVYGILPRQYVAAELLERVEVFRGANSFLNGAAPGGSGVGGAINLVPKRAPNEPLNRVTLGFENDGQGYGAVDFARRFGSGEGVGVRLNAVRRDGETSIEDQDRELTVLSLGSDYQGERFRFSADIGYQDHHIDAPRPSVTPAGGIPRAPDAGSNFAQPWTYTDEEQLFGAVRGEYDVTDSITVWAAAGGRDGKEDNVLANPTAVADGTTTTYRFDNVREDEVFSADAGVRGEFATGPVEHRLVLSGSTVSLKSRNAYAFSNFAGFAGSLYDTVTVEPPAADFFVGGSLSDPRVTERTDNSGIAVADMLSFLDGAVLLTLGVRYQEIETKSYDYNTGAELSRYKDDATTPSVALVYKPMEEVSLYGNYAESLQPGQIAPATSGGVPVLNAGEVLAPFRAKQYEVGAKYDGGDFGGTLSLFSTTLPSAFVIDNVFTDAGRQRNRGAELSLFGEPVDGLRVLGGLTWVEAELRRTADGLFEGNTAVGVPDLQANLNVAWDVPAVPGLTLDTRLTYTASQYTDAANATEIPSWTRWDLGVGYETEIMGRPVSLRGRVENVMDKDYWASAGGFPGANYLVLGGPRTFVLSASTEF